MDKAMKLAVAEYGRVIKKDGWEAGEKIIRKYEKKFPDFEKWAHALGVMLRANEILEEEDRSTKKRSNATR